MASISKINPATTFAWTDGTPFTGFLLFALIPPIIGDVVVSKFALGGVTPECRIPQFTIIPITAGRIGEDGALLYNSDISPPGTEYVAFIYDVSKRLIEGPSTPFTVSTASFNVPTFLMLTPWLQGDTPTPDYVQDETSIVMLSIYGGYYTITPVGSEVTINLSNGLNQRLNLTSNTPLTILDPVRSGGTLVAGMTFTLFIYQDATGSRPTPTFGSAFDTSVGSFEVPTDPNSFVVLQFLYHNDGKWRLNFVGPTFI